MKLIPDWRKIALQSYSMWSIYLGLLCLVLPNMLWGFFEIESDPYMQGWAALILFVGGAVGRLVDQALSGRWGRWLFLGTLTVGALLVALSLGGAVVEDITLPDTEEVGAIDRQAMLIPAMGNRVAVSPAPPIANMPVKDAAFLEVAVPFVGKWEGLRLMAYRDIVGVWTVCYGETKGVRPGDIYTKAQCDTMLARELIAYRRGWHGYLSEETRTTRLPVYRDVAYTSLAYNVGIAGAGKSTATRRLNSGDIKGGCEALTWWNKSGGRVVRGLVNRRAEELALCLMGLA